MKDETIDQIKTSIEYLADLILENSGVYREYSDEDLSNAMIILYEVFMTKMYDFHRGKITSEGMEKLAVEAGISLHQTMKLFTGVDLNEIYNK